LGGEAERHLLVTEGCLERGAVAGAVRYRASADLPAPRDCLVPGTFPYAKAINWLSRSDHPRRLAYGKITADTVRSRAVQTGDMGDTLST
jgi:hypothetical protein